MTFAKYNLRDNAFATLDAWIGASTTTITLTLWQGVRFPTSNTILTLVEYNTLWDPSSGVLKREKVLLTSRSSDILTVTRGFDGDTPTSFQAWDFIYLNVVSEVIEDIQDEVERLEDDKLDITTYNSTTRDNLTPYRLLYIDSTGNETELALWTAGQTLISQGATSNPIWQVPSVDIFGLTEDEVGNMENDEFVKRDGTGNKKIKLTRYRASDADMITGTTNAKFVSVQKSNTIIVWSDSVIASGGNTNVILGNNTYVKRWEFEITKDWVYRWLAQAITTQGTQSNYIVSVAIYKNWVLQAEVQSGSGFQSGLTATISHDVSCVAWDLLQVYIKLSSAHNFRLNYFRIWASEFKQIFLPTENTI